MITKTFYLPPIQIEERVRFKKRYFVVRDDVLVGGTKTRFFRHIVTQSPKHEFVYASPAFGYAQIALADVCARLGRQAVIFTAARANPHECTLKAKALGARIEWIAPGYLTVVQARAREYVDENFNRATLIPFGGKSSYAQDLFAEEISALKLPVPEVWVAVGSGVLLRTLQAALPKSDFVGVSVGKETFDVGAARMYRAPEKFERPAFIPPPFPSCVNYVAKVWRFFKNEFVEDALFWNVAA